jgi:hypothetical protein
VIEKRNFIWLQVYFYLVCFSTLIIMIIGGIRLVTNIADLVFPTPPPAPGFTEMALRFKDLQQQGLNISWEEFKEEREKEYTQQHAWERARAMRGLMASLASVLIPLPIYLFHWRYIKKVS